MYERFTDRARQVMQLANQEAQRLGHDDIDTGDLLVGLVEELGGVASNVLKNLGVKLREVRQFVATRTSGDRDDSDETKRVVELAMEEALSLQHRYVGTEHLLLGLLRVDDGVAVKALAEFRLDVTEIREEVLSLLGHGLP